MGLILTGLKIAAIWLGSALCVLGIICGLFWIVDEMSGRATPRNDPPDSEDY